MPHPIAGTSPDAANASVSIVRVIAFMLSDTAAAPSQFQAGSGWPQPATTRLHVDPVLSYIQATKRLHMTATTATDRIEKTVIMKAPRSRIWQALSDAKQ